MSKPCTYSRVLSLVLWFGACVCGLSGPMVWAQTPPWPTKPISLIVTYPPGGGADAMARLVAPKMAEVLGQNVVVETAPVPVGKLVRALWPRPRLMAIRC